MLLKMFFFCCNILPCQDPHFIYSQSFLPCSCLFALPSRQEPPHFACAPGSCCAQSSLEVSLLPSLSCLTMHFFLSCLILPCSCYQNHESEHVNSTADLREKLREEQNGNTMALDSQKFRAWKAPREIIGSSPPALGRKDGWSFFMI